MELLCNLRFTFHPPFLYHWSTLTGWTSTETYLHVSVGRGRCTDLRHVVSFQLADDFSRHHLRGCARGWLCLLLCDVFILTSFGFLFFAQYSLLCVLRVWIHTLTLPQLFSCLTLKLNGVHILMEDNRRGLLFNVVLSPWLEWVWETC